MKFFVIAIVFLMAATGYSQSKKELQAEVSSLKAEIEQLKKPKEIVLNDTTAKASYGMGVLIATNLKSQGGDSLNVEAICSGIVDVLESKSLKMDQQESMMIVQEFMQQAMEKKNIRLSASSKRFLEENKAKEGVTVTGSGLQYEVVSAGKGKQPGANDNVTVHYTGKLVDGTVFDSSVERGEPASFGVSQVISGWTEALQLMHEGDKWIIYIPYDLGYGERGAPPHIPPFSTLIFEVELLKVN